MAMKQLWIHLGWAGAAGAAFVIGSMTGKPSTEEIARAAAAQRTERYTTRPGGGARGEDAAARIGGRSAGDEGPLTRLLGSLSLKGAGLEAVAEQAVRNPSPIARRIAFARLLEGMTAGNAMEIRGQLVALGGAQGDMWNDFNYAWGALAGREAFEFARTSDEPDLGAAMTGWAAADPAAALALLDQLPEDLEKQRRSLEGNVVAGIADHDINLASEIAMRFGESDPAHGNRLMREVAGEALRGGGVETASLWVASLPDGVAKGSAMRRVTESYVRQDPQAAAAWAEQFAGQDYARSAIGEIGDEWAERDPQAAVSWLETLPAGGAQNAGFAQALGEWEDNDPQAAGDYLMSMERSPQRDAAIAGFASGYAWQDPATALAWAQDISDPQMRERSLTQVGQAYYRRDPEGALGWLETSGLSPEAQRQIIHPPGRWRR
jgi:hypothetical protein